MTEKIPDYIGTGTYHGITAAKEITIVTDKIGADLRPMVPIVVEGAGGQERKIPVLLSTGFREALLLPAAEVAALGLPQTGKRSVEFPNGSRIVATVHPT